MVLETRKLELSAICTCPPLVTLLGVTPESEKTNGNSGAPALDATVACASASGPGTLPWKIQRFCSGMLRNASAGTPKFFASTSGGVCASQSVASPCSECGRPGGKYQRSPSLTSATNGRPRASSTVTRQLP